MSTTSAWVTAEGQDYEIRTGEDDLEAGWSRVRTAIGTEFCLFREGGFVTAYATTSDADTKIVHRIAALILASPRRRERFVAECDLPVSVLLPVHFPQGSFQTVKS